MESARQDTAAVITQGLTMRFGSVTALDRVNFTLPTGTILGLLGPNGSGKTTLLSILAGFIAPTAGNFQALGESSHRLALARTGSLISRPLLWPHLSCRDNLRCVQGIHTGRQDREEVERLLEQVGLSGQAATRKFRQCSTGMKQRLGIAAALLNDPELLLLDEPTNGLDPEGMVEVRELVRELSRQPGRSIIMSSHLLNEVERTCDHYAIIYRGILADQGRIGDVPTNHPANSPSTCISTTDNARALRHLQEKGWDAAAAGSAGSPADSPAPGSSGPDDANPSAITVLTAPGEEWKPARDLAEINIFPTAMRPAAPGQAAGTLEEKYLAAVGQAEAGSDGDGDRDGDGDGQC